MMELKVYIHDLKQTEVISPSSKGGWIIKKPFMLVDRNFTPVEGVTFYEGAIIKTIIDKRGQEVPIIKVWPHTCNIKCGEKCKICGLELKHQFELKTEYSTEEEDLTCSGWIKIIHLLLPMKIFLNSLKNQSKWRKVIS